ncbi:MAG: hypothetical protein IJL78_03450 [Lachnospiraceae bacterium]|nr:hypothetical protein [Lachnospiraceae bacterium]
MNDILVGNICALAAMVSDSVSGTRKKRNEILGIQLLSQFFYAAGFGTRSSRTHLCMPCSIS